MEVLLMKNEKNEISPQIIREALAYELYVFTGTNELITRGLS